MWAGEAKRLRELDAAMAEDRAWLEELRAAARRGEYDDDGRDCLGHVDTDEALLSGVGIGEAVYCDGSCRTS
jgi:hypothetical protein